MEMISTLLALCEGNLLCTGDSSYKGPVVWSFDEFFDVSLKSYWLNIQIANDL